MKISWNWLSQLVNLTTMNIDELAQKLTLAGFEVENIIRHPDIQDTIFEIDITANRSDVNSIISIAKEITAICNIESSIYETIKLKNFHVQYKQINYADALEPYTNFIYSYIKNIQVNTYNSPRWLQNYLIAYDMEPTHSILDIIELINLKWGQSIQLYILNKSAINAGNKLLDLTRLIDNNNQNFKTKIDSSNINKYKDQQIDIILINYVKKQSQQYNSQLNNSNTKYLKHGLIDSLSLIKKIYSINTTRYIIYLYNINAPLKKYINCNIDKVNHTLGPLKHGKHKNYLNKPTIIQILQRLNFSLEDYGNELKIAIPEERQSDIQKDIDIIEEIGRVYGFNHFIDQLPMLPKQGSLSITRSITKKIRHILRSMSLHEVIHFSFRPDLIDHKIQIINPLNQDQQSLRVNLIENLIETTIYNINKANETFEVFEIGKVFVPNQRNNKHHEYLHLAGILGNNTFNRSTWYLPPDELSWFQAKGQLEEFLERIDIRFKWSIYSEDNYLTHNLQRFIHPKRTCYIQSNKRTIGLLSQLNNRIASNLGISYTSYIFEINIDLLIPLIKKNNELVHAYQQYSNYPKITRDISISINKYQTIQEIINVLNTIKTEESKIIESINIFDEYSNTPTTKKIGLRITYRSKTATLTNKKIERIEKIFEDRINQQVV